MELVDPFHCRFREAFMYDICNSTGRDAVKEQHLSAPQYSEILYFMIPYLYFNI